MKKTKNLLKYRKSIKIKRNYRKSIKKLKGGKKTRRNNKLRKKTKLRGGGKKPEETNADKSEWVNEAKIDTPKKTDWWCSKCSQDKIKLYWNTMIKFLKEHKHITKPTNKQVVNLIIEERNTRRVFNKKKYKSEGFNDTFSPEEKNLFHLKYMAVKMENNIKAKEADHKKTLEATGTNIEPRIIKGSHVKRIGKKIGEGAFGEVFKAALDESNDGGVPEYLVACKSVTDPTGNGVADLVQEAMIMAQVGIHENLVSLIGVSEDPPLLIMQLCEHGSLKSQLIIRPFGKGVLAPTNKGGIPPKIESDIALDIAKGMEHLLGKNVVHRDLAARNILLNSRLTCKVADFGLSRVFDSDPETKENVYASTAGVFPMRWTAPEAMETLKFSEKTDVWSFGIVLLEIVTDGDKPLKDLTDDKVIPQVQGGYTPPKPVGCSDKMYAVMKTCWNRNPLDRPSFAKLVETFSEDDFGGLGPSEITNNHNRPRTRKTPSGSRYTGYNFPSSAGPSAGARAGIYATGEQYDEDGYVMPGNSTTQSTKIYPTNKNNVEVINESGAYVMPGNAPQQQQLYAVNTEGTTKTTKTANTNKASNEINLKCEVVTKTK